MSGEEYMGFGYWKACPPYVAIAWGARAIFNRGELDLLYDRQDWNGTGKDDKKVRNAFTRLVNACLPEFRREVKALWEKGELKRDVDKEFTYDVGHVRFVFNTNGSCGYLYIVAFMY